MPRRDRERGGQERQWWVAGLRRAASEQQPEVGGGSHVDSCGVALGDTHLVCLRKRKPGGWC